MENPSLSYILSRGVTIIALIVALLFGFGFYKKHQRRSAIVSELNSITSDSSFFQQFYAEDAKKTLVRAIGLITEANSLGMEPEKAINLGMGIKPQLFENELDDNDPSARESIIRDCLSDNYQNVRKLGYQSDFHTLDAMKNGELPSIPAGPHQGRKPEIGYLIDPKISPGMEKVVANLVIRPPREDEELTDIEVAAAKMLANDLRHGGYIEDSARDRILKALTQEKPKPKP